MGASIAIERDFATSSRLTSRARHTQTLLTTSEALRIEVAWVPGHKGIVGNERADTIAKEGVHGTPLIHSTISWARAKATSRALKAWRSEWAQRSHNNLASIALRQPPSTNLSSFHRNFDGPRDVHTRIIQTIVGHGFRGDYYARFVPTEPTACPCGDAPIQTRDHILADCPLFEDQRHYLRAVSRTLSTPFILGTHAGLSALSKFVGTSRAFAKVPNEFPPPLDPDNVDPG